MHFATSTASGIHSNPSTHVITGLLKDWQDGDDGALEDLMNLAYQELKNRARRFLRQERRGFVLQTTDLVHEAFIRIIGIRQTWESRNHFFAIVAKKMRELLIDRARARQTLRRGGDIVFTDLDWQDVAVEASAELLSLHDALDDLARLDPRKAEILELRYFAGLLNSEIAGFIGVSESTIEREQRLARAWLGHQLQDSQN